MELGKRNNFSYLLRNSKPQNIYLGLQPISLIQELWRKQSDLILPLASELKTHTHTHTHSSQGIPTGWNLGQYKAIIRVALRETSWGLPWQSSGWDSVLPLQEVWVWSLVGELRYHIPCSGTALKKEGKKKERERNILVWLKFLIKAQLLNIDNKWPCHYCFQISMKHSGL